MMYSIWPMAQQSLSVKSSEINLSSVHVSFLSIHHSCKLSITRWCVGSWEGCDTLSAAFQNWPAWAHYSRHLCGTVGWNTVRPSTSAVFTHTVNHVHMNCNEIICPNIAEGCGSKSVTGNQTTSSSPGSLWGESLGTRLRLTGVYHNTTDIS